jgi:endonuclease III
MNKLADFTPQEILDYFLWKKPHRFNENLAKDFYRGIQRIHTVYGDDASQIWKGEPSSAAVVYRFLSFEGVGIKIATMATNILARDLGVKFSDYYAIDISPDVHVMRVFYRAGLVENPEKREAVVYKAKEMYPEFPGIIDLGCWEIGRNYCDPTNPKCEMCPLEDECRYARESLKR